MNTQTPATPLISVVVPFYNVRECVGYCIKSLLSQTFEGPYEVLCVDDGSTDGTGELLEEYAADPRVVVLHKENGGLSDARNYGVERAQAELVTFVDGDDLIAPNYLEALYGARESTGSDISLCLFKLVSEKGASVQTWNKSKASIVVFNRLKAVKRSLRGRPMVAAWGRLAPKATYLSHPFPKGKVYEDQWMIGDHFFSFDSFVLVEAPLYGYVQRSGSIAHSLSAASETTLRNYVQAVLRMDDVSSALVDADDSDLIFHRALDASRLWRLAANVNPCTDYTKRVMTETRAYVKSALPRLISDSNTGGVSASDSSCSQRCRGCMSPLFAYTNGW